MGWHGNYLPSINKKSSQSIGRRRGAPRANVESLNKDVEFANTDEESASKDAEFQSNAESIGKDVESTGKDVESSDQDVESLLFNRDMFKA
jgi:hypothetical protein